MAATPPSANTPLPGRRFRRGPPCWRVRHPPQPGSPAADRYEGRLTGAGGTDTADLGWEGGSGPLRSRGQLVLDLAPEVGDVEMELGQALGLVPSRLGKSDDEAACLVDQELDLAHLVVDDPVLADAGLGVEHQLLAPVAAGGAGREDLDQEVGSALDPSLQDAETLGGDGDRVPLAP